MAIESVNRLLIKSSMLIRFLALSAPVSRPLLLPLKVFSHTSQQMKDNNIKRNKISGWINDECVLPSVTWISGSLALNDWSSRMSIVSGEDTSRSSSQHQIHVRPRDNDEEQQKLCIFPIFHISVLISHCSRSYLSFYVLSFIRCVFFIHL